MINENFEQITEMVSNLPIPGEYSYRTGTLPPMVQPAGIETSGAITAPGDFFRAKYKAGDKLTNENVIFRYTDMLVKYNMEEGTIEFLEDIASTNASSRVNGKLRMNKDLKALSINTQKVYTSQQLADVLKFNRLLFDNSDDCMNIVSKLKKFSAQISTQIVNSNDNQGNKNLTFAQNVATELNLSFVLHCDIFTGIYSNVKFKVDIEFDLRDKTIEFWLVSTELKELIDQRTKDIIDDQLISFKTVGVPCIQIG